MEGFYDYMVKIRGDILAEVTESVSFTRKMKGSTRYLVVPEQFVKDLDYSDKHIMIMLRVTGPDMDMVPDFFEDAEDEVFTLETTDKEGNEISGEYVLSSIYIDEGPHLSVDIDIEPPMVRAILDFERK